MQQDAKTPAMDHDSPIPVEGGSAPLIAHIIYRLDVGGLENGVANLINAIPNGEFRHAVICLTDYTDFRNRITRPDVEVFALNKGPGIGLSVHLKLWKLLRRLKPDIVHSRNLAALECQVTAAAAGVPVRVHGEHGWDVRDLDGSNRRRVAIRRTMRPFVHHYIALSRHLEQYLLTRVGVHPSRLSQVYNGVDTDKFRPSIKGDKVLPASVTWGSDAVVVGTVGRMEPVKDPLNLAQAFVKVVEMMPEIRQRLRLVMIGDGTLRPQVAACLDAAGLASQVWLPGACSNIPEIMRALDVFVLPSLAEGISNTILEAMASGLPVVATDTGGNPELIEDGNSGGLVRPADPDALASAIVDYIRQPAVRSQHSRRARELALERFSLSSMVLRYIGIYHSLLKGRAPDPAGDRTHHLGVKH